MTCFCRKHITLQWLKNMNTHPLCNSQLCLEAKTTNGSDRNRVSVISITLTKEIRSGHSTTSTLGTQ